MADPPPRDDAPDPADKIFARVGDLDEFLRGLHKLANVIAAGLILGIAESSVRARVARTRAHVALSRLRRLGLGPWLVHVGDGWLLSAVWRAQENRSDLAVFNARDVEAGPVALVHLGHRVIPIAGHNLPQEEPGAFAAAVMELIKA